MSRVQQSLSSTQVTMVNSPMSRVGYLEAQNGHKTRHRYPKSYFVTTADVVVQRVDMHSARACLNTHDFGHFSVHFEKQRGIPT